MTDTLSKEQVEALQFRTPYLVALRATALAVMEERRVTQVVADDLAVEVQKAWSRIAQLEGENSALQRMLEKATTRIGILRDRMEACDAEHPTQSHGLSLDEAPAWIEEQRALLSSPGRAPETPPEKDFAERLGEFADAQRVASSGAEPRAIPSDAERDAVDAIMEDPGVFRAWAQYDNAPYSSRELARELTRAIVHAFIEELRADSRVREAAGRVPEGNSNAETV
jgi:hypothetical protein